MSGYHSVLVQIREVFSYTGFMLIMTILQVSGLQISSFYLGHLGTVYLDAVGLGNSIYHVFGLLTIQGFLSGCETLMSQSYGSSNKLMVGIYLQKGFIAVSFVSFLCIVFMLNCKHVLRVFGQDDDVIDVTVEYVTALSPSLISFAIWNIVVRYFRIQGVLMIVVLTRFANVTISAVGHYLLVEDYGVKGSAVAQLLGNFVGAILIVVFAPCHREAVQKTWPGFSWESTHGFSHLCVLSIAGVLLLISQWFDLAVCNFLAGSIGKVELASQSILFQINMLCRILPDAFAVGCNILMSRSLGANEPLQAKLIMKICWGSALIIGCFSSVILFVLSDVIPSIYSDVSEVTKMASSVIFPYFALFRMSDSFVIPCLMLFRAVARPRMGAAVSMFGAYCVGLPLAIHFGSRMGVQGYWLGMSLGSLTNAITLGFEFLRTDWEKECQDAQIRAGLKPKKISDVENGEELSKTLLTTN